jgi:hypothetical protein
MSEPKIWWMDDEDVKDTPKVWELSELISATNPLIVQDEYEKQRALASALAKLYAIQNRVEIVPSGDELTPQRTFITIYDIDYITHEIVQEQGETLTEAIENALAAYERVSKS